MRRPLSGDPTTSGRHILVHSDGSSDNPGPGGYAAVLRRMNGDTELKRKTVRGFETETTTNVRMEMMAAVVALEAIKPGEPEPIVIYSDNNLLSKAMNEWVEGWIARGWRGADRKPVSNQDLWERLLSAADNKTVHWRWVRGHAGHPFNEEADGLARRELAKARASALRNGRR